MEYTTKQTRTGSGHGEKEETQKKRDVVYLCVGQEQNDERGKRDNGGYDGIGQKV